MSHVFISYKTEDRPRVRLLVDALTADGIDIWWDVQIEGGADWREAIQERLNAAACVIVVWSDRSTGADGRFVQDEASRASRRGVLLPVCIDPVEPPLGFGQHQCLSLLDWRGDRKEPAYQHVLAATRAIIDGRAPPKLNAIETLKPTRRGVLGAAPPVAVGALVLGIVFRKPLGAALGGFMPAAQAAPVRSLAVLPFANVGDDASQAYFSDGLSEELLDRLARIGQLQVSGRTSSFKFKGSREGAATIAGKLGVAYILDGSVRRDGDAVRVSAQLVEAKSGFTRWGETYNRQLKDVFAVQSDIADAVAQALKIKLLGNDGASTAATDSTSPAALDAYLQGKRLFNDSGDEASLQAALAKFEAAIATNPSFSKAWSGKARTLLTLANQYTPVARIAQQYADALDAAKRAVALDPGDAMAQLTVGETLLYTKLNFAAAQVYFDRARSGGGSAEVLGLVGQFDCRRGAFGLGLDALRKAAVLDRLNPRAFKGLGAGLIAARRYAEAINAYGQVLVLSGRASSAHAGIGYAHYLLRDFAAAKQAFEAEPAAFQRLTGLAITAHALGATADAQAALASLLSSGDVVNYQQAQVLAQWGDRPGALAALAAGLQAKDSGLLLMKTDPLMDPLRGSPAFADLLRQLG